LPSINKNVARNCYKAPGKDQVTAETDRGIAPLKHLTLIGEKNGKKAI